MLKGDKMDINRGCILTLDDDRRYVVVSKVNYNGKRYLYMVDIENHSDIKMCLENRSNNNIRLIEVEDNELVIKLINEFFIDVKDIMKEIVNAHQN